MEDVDRTINTAAAVEGVGDMQEEIQSDCLGHMRLLLVQVVMPAVPVGVVDPTGAHRHSVRPTRRPEVTEERRMVMVEVVEVVVGLPELP